MTGGEYTPVAEFADVIARRDHLQSLLEGSEVAELVQAGIAKANDRLTELAADPAVEEHYRSIGEPVLKAARDLELVAPDLEALGLADEVAAKRQAVGELLAQPEMVLVQEFFRIRGKVDLVPHVTASEAQPDEAEKLPKDGDVKREDETTKLTITIDPNFNIAVNGRPRSISRQLKATRQDTRSEVEVRQWRVSSLEVLASNPGRKMKASEIFAITNPGEKFNGKEWGWFVGSFFNEEFKFGHKPVVTVEKVTPRLKVYSLENFEVEITKTDKALTIKDESIFTFPNGDEVAGKTGQLLNKLIKANENKPVTEADVRTLYTEDELNAIQRTTGIYSGLISVARREATARGFTIVKLPTGKVNPKTRRPHYGYYMVKKEQEDTGQGSEPETEPASQQLTVLEEKILARFLLNKREELIAVNVRPLDEAVYDGLHALWIEEGGERNAPEDVSKIRASAFKKTTTLVEDEEKLFAALEALDDVRDTARLRLLEYLADLDDAQREMIQELLQARPVIEFEINDGRKGGAGVVQRMQHRRRAHGRPRR